MPSQHPADTDDLHESLKSNRCLSTSTVRMPYTPPTLQSPVASGPNSPVLSRKNSYTQSRKVASPTVGPASRPNLPRSHSSTSYLSKHRRSPSAPQTPSFSFSPSTPDASPDNVDAGEQTANGSHRQSPSPVNRTLKPTGSVISPPNSSPSSSDDERSARQAKGRGRELENLAELQAAIQNIEQNRESSPNRISDETRKAGMALTLVVPHLAASAKQEVPSAEGSPLSKEACKISHSRSAIESISIRDMPRQNLDSPGRSASDTDSDDDGEDKKREKPLMVRKKSGELVRPALRPSSAKRRPSSMPGTPTCSKAVHFDQHLEHVRHFLQVDRPVAVSAGSSPVESYEGDIEFPFGSDDSGSSRSPPFEWGIRLTNFPRDSAERMFMPVRVEKVFLSSDNKNLVGAISVTNIAFHKLVVARFSLDYWKTTSEVVAEYNNDVRRKQTNDGHDRFHFTIKLADLANLENKTMFFCVRYNVNGQEFWDNNDSINFQVDFTKKPKPQNGKSGMQGAGARPLNALPRSRPNSPSKKPQRQTSFDDFAGGFEPRYDFGSFAQPATKIIGESPIRFRNSKASNNSTADGPSRRGNTAGQAFGNRYDFGASLSAAIQAAGNALGDGSGLQYRDAAQPAAAKQPPFGQTPFVEAIKINSPHSESPRNFAASAIKPTTKPAALTSEKPSLQSPSYTELLDEYCFYGSAKTGSQGTERSSPQSRAKLLFWDGDSFSSSTLANTRGDQHAVEYKFYSPHITICFTSD
ncbi:MAG: hypothetical protein FRX48_04953 [Lasallia pustulata]|uniref:CBM21 domain-containing protein n=1 Tax=Lasallia pustulata TaxID=136370 RepID=A0A5M8PRJ5_9LECA|nr:MAG: hypothetical protein FRX48_04953 [Lasallia pustulata]